MIEKGARRGFTLIELLVVIAIIGVLSSVVLASLNSARGKAQDARRMSDVHQIALALIQAADDNGGTFPSSGGKGVCLGTTGSCWGSVFTGSASVNTAIQKYMPAIPADPSRSSGKGDRYIYMDSVGGTSYHCDGSTYPRGPFIAWVPDSTDTPTSDTQCKNATYFGCAMSGTGGADGRYCVYQIQ
jgi:prepilin-type N-terminal cleavage/methylation domain-containing protein